MKITWFSTILLRVFNCALQNVKTKMCIKIFHMQIENSSYGCNTSVEISDGSDGCFHRGTFGLNMNTP